MSRIAPFVCCLAIEQDDNQIKIVNPINTVKLKSFPNNFSFIINFTLVDFDFNPENLLKLTIKDPFDETVFDSGELPYPEGYVNNNKITNSINIALNLNNLTIENVGEYNIFIKSHEEQIDSFPLYFEEDVSHE